MFGLALVLLLIGLVAGYFGFIGTAVAFVGVAKIVFFVAIVLAILFFLNGRR